MASSSGDGAPPRRTHAPEVALARGRSAFDAARRILARFPAARDDLRRLLRAVDDGEAVQVDGVPDPSLRALLERLFANLPTRVGERSRAFSLERGAPKTLATLAPVFDATAEERRETEERKRRREEKKRAREAKKKQKEGAGA